MRRLLVAILVVVIVLAGMAGWHLVRDATPPGTPSVSIPDLDQAVEYLANSYNPELGLLYESPALPHTYWLVSDNLLAYQVLRDYHPEVAANIAERLRDLAVRYNLPRDDNGLPVSFEHEALLGATVPLPFKTAREYVLEDGTGYTLKTVVCDGEVMPDWKEYGDLLCYGALSKYYQGETEEALEYFEIAANMWDGKGLVDKAFAAENRYTSYKLGLLLFTSKTLGRPLPFEETLINTLCTLQEEDGGFTTHYLSDGTPDGFTNTETTCIILLSLQKWATA